MVEGGNTAARAEQAVKMWYRDSSLLDYLPDAALAIDTEGRVTVWNRAMEELTGVPAQEILGKGDFEYAIPFYGERRPMLIDFVISGDEELLSRYYPDVSWNAGMLVGEDSHTSSHGEKRVFRVKASPIHDANGECIGAVEVIHDITDLVEQREHMQRAIHKLLLLNQITRHDILNSMLVVGGYLELLPDEGDLTERGKEYLDACMRSLDTIKQILLFTREYQDLGLHGPWWQEPAPLVERCCERMITMGRSLVISIDLPDIEIYADPLLERVFCNVIQNSFRHADGATHLDVSGRMEEDGTFVITFSDDGPGIPEQEKDEIFMPSSSSVHGHGLFLVSEILDLTGISIRECGTPGVGARFEIRVPAGRWRRVERAEGRPGGGG